MLELKNVSKTLGPLKILKNISMRVPSGTIAGIVGPSGSGKSTLLRCIAGLEVFDSGGMHQLGTPKSIGFMFQDFQLFEHFNVLKNLTYAPLINLKSPPQEITNKAMSLLKTLGLHGKEQDSIACLSGGQKQRVALARSMMMEPGILLCDEPTSGLDVVTTLEVSQLLQSVHTKTMTMIIASHDLGFLSKLAHHIFFFHRGSLVKEWNLREDYSGLQEGAMEAMIRAFYQDTLLELHPRG